MKKKILTLLLALLTVSPALYAQEMNKPANGDGKKESPYQISTAAELRWFANEVNNNNYFACATLMQDIDLNPQFTFDENGYHGPREPVQWEPIYWYAGIFDGKGYNIKGLYIIKNDIKDNHSRRGRPALFAYVSEIGLLKNIGVENSYICVNEAGGICGTNIGTLYNCYNAATIICSSNQIAFDIGGICAMNYGVISHCYNVGKVTAFSESYAVGGICGTNSSGVISNCYNKGTITVKDGNIGGICGSSTDGSTIHNCYNSGEIIGIYRSTTGGICGNFQNSLSLDNCYNVGNINKENIADGIEVGEICGLFYSSLLYNCYFLEGTTNQGIASDYREDLPNSGTKAKNIQELVFLMNNNVFNAENRWSSSACFENSILRLPTLNNEPFTTIRLYTTSVRNTDGGTVNTSGGTYKKGEIVNVIAIPNIGYRFVNWKDEFGVVVSTQSNYTFTVTSAVSLTARFEQDIIDPIPYYSVNINAAMGGTVNTFGGTYKDGETVNVIAMPNIGYRFANWKDAFGVVVSTQSNYTFRITKDITLTACFDFEMISYSIYLDSPILKSNALSIGGGGSVIINLIPSSNYNIDNMVVKYKRGEYGTWQILEKEGYDIYVIDDILSDIYVKTEGIVFVANETIANEDIRVYTENGHLFIYTPRQQYVNIISSGGRVIRREKQSGLQRYDGVGQGVYFIQVDNRSFKVMITG